MKYVIIIGIIIFIWSYNQKQNQLEKEAERVSIAASITDADIETARLIWLGNLACLMNIEAVTGKTFISPGSDISKYTANMYLLDNFYRLKKLKDAKLKETTSGIELYYRKQFNEGYMKNGKNAYVHAARFAIDELKLPKWVSSCETLSDYSKAYLKDQKFKQRK